MITISQILRSCLWKLSQPTLLLGQWVRNDPENWNYFYSFASLFCFAMYCTLLSQASQIIQTIVYKVRMLSSPAHCLSFHTSPAHVVAPFLQYSPWCTDLESDDEIRVDFETPPHPYFLPILILLCTHLEVSLSSQTIIVWHFKDKVGLLSAHCHTTINVFTCLHQSLTS